MKMETSQNCFNIEKSVRTHSTDNNVKECRNMTRVVTKCALSLKKNLMQSFSFIEIWDIHLIMRDPTTIVLSHTCSVNIVDTIEFRLWERESVCCFLLFNRQQALALRMKRLYLATGKYDLNNLYYCILSDWVRIVFWFWFQCSMFIVYNECNVSAVWRIQDWICREYKTANIKLLVHEMLLLIDITFILRRQQVALPNAKVWVGTFKVR